MDTVNVILSTPGPRLVTPAVTLPNAGNGCGTALAHAALQNKTAADTQTGTGRGAAGIDPT
jgi:hypothetical protein